MALETVVLLEFLLCRGDNTNEIKQREVQRRENVDKNKKWPGKETLPEDRITCDGGPVVRGQWSGRDCSMFHCGHQGCNRKIP